MIIEPVPWHNDRNICPADFDFADYLNTLNSMQRIFHMGPGYFHTLAKNTIGHSIVAITHSPSELSSYMSMAIEDVHMALRYQVMFGDIHHFDRRMLGRLDMVSLFHLGEKGSPNGFSMKQVIGMFYDVPLIVMYAGSFTFDPAESLILETRQKSDLEFKSLRFYFK